MRIRSIFLIFATLLTLSCSNDDNDGKEDELTPNEKINNWVYSQMKHHYLWAEDIPSKGDLNFSQDISNFYRSIKSDKDRFSYYENNLNYNGSLDVKKYAMWQDWRNFSWNYSPVFCQDDMFPRHKIPKASSMQYSIMHVGTKVVGYILYYGFRESNELAPALQEFKENNVTHIILDLRYNGGGQLNTAIFLSSCIIPDEMRGTDAQYLVYNKQVTLEKYGIPDGHETYRYLTTDQMRQCDLNIKHAYFLVSGSTASASESTIGMVKPYTPTTIIGQKTTGKGVGMYDLSDNNYPYTLVPITFRYYNAKWETVPDEGITPDVEMEKVYPDRSENLGKPDEPLLEKALELIAAE